MYCSTCGVPVAQGLSFCKHCGAKLSDGKGDDFARYSELRAESFLIMLMVAVFIFGLGAITVLMAVMKNGLNFEAPQVIPFAIISFAMLFLLEGMLIWRLLRRDRHAKGRAAAERHRAHDPRLRAHLHRAKVGLKIQPPEKLK